jgi:hypothetical protein
MAGLFLTSLAYLQPFGYGGMIIFYTEESRWPNDHRHFKSCNYFIETVTIISETTLEILDKASLPEE